MRERRRPLRRLATLGAASALVAAVLAACGSSGGPVLANAPVVRPTPAPTPVPQPRPADPQPISFPRDDGPHDRLTEWWYDTGHLVDDQGHRYGFEFVIFRAERGALPVTWAAHAAVTDESGDRFVYSQRSEVGPQVDASPRSSDGAPTGFALAIRGADPSRPATLVRPPWTMVGASGRDRVSVRLSPDEAEAAGAPGGLGLQLDLTTLKPPALHGGAGWIDFGPAGASYYYSRTRLAATGTLLLDGRTVHVTGEAWFDHQWGDFIAVGGGWDWFAVELGDGRDLTISLVRDTASRDVLTYGTLVRADGSVVHLAASAFSVVITAHWMSPRTGAVYPAGWILSLPAEGLEVRLRPTVADQELDTRATSGVVYWEGSQVVSASSGGREVPGQAYVELTGYAPAVPPKG